MRMKKYERPQYYIGPDYYNYYVFMGQHRDSDIVSRCNFRVACDRLKAIAGNESENTWIIIRDHHWAVGWIETIYIHENATAAIDEAEKMLDEIESYPVLNDSVLSDMEYEEINNYWDGLSVGEKIKHCKDSEESIFSARRLPEKVYDYLRETLV